MKNWQTIIAEQIEGKADLQALYNKLNKELFNNELPKIQIRWTNATRVAGEVAAQMEFKKNEKRVSKIMPQMGKITKWKFLGISKKFNLDDISLKGIMAHEMIHVHLLHNGIIFTSGRDGMHGHEFRDRLKIVRARANFPIPETETHLASSDKLVARPTGYVWMKQNNKNFIVKAGPKFLEKNLQKAINWLMKFFVSFSSIPSETESVEIGVAETSMLETIKGIRKVPWKGWSNMSDEKIRLALQNKQVLFRKVRGIS